jgi:hypothetical protein
VGEPENSFGGIEFGVLRRKRTAAEIERHRSLKKTEVL